MLGCTYICIWYYFVYIYMYQLPLHSAGQTIHCFHNFPNEHAPTDRMTKRQMQHRRNRCRPLLPAYDHTHTHIDTHNLYQTVASTPQKSFFCRPLLPAYDRIDIHSHNLSLPVKRRPRRRRSRSSVGYFCVQSCSCLSVGFPIVLHLCSTGLQLWCSVLHLCCSEWQWSWFIHMQKSLSATFACRVLAFWGLSFEFRNLGLHCLG